MVRAGDHGTPAELVSEEEATTEAIHAAAHPGRDRAQEAHEAHDPQDAQDAADATKAAEAAESTG